MGYTFSSELEARGLALKILKYWKDKGHTIKAEAVFLPASGRAPPHWAVRTNLVNGRPPTIPTVEQRA